MADASKPDRLKGVARRWNVVGVLRIERKKPI